VTLIIAILIYAVSMTLANLTVAAFGPVVTPVNGFVMIGLDLTLRDWLHVRLRPWQLGILIVVAGILTYALFAQTPGDFGLIPAMWRVRWSIPWCFQPWPLALSCHRSCCSSSWQKPAVVLSGHGC
jgi:hypothetical protein